jgi:predicted ATPase/transcriptional regulator with XRE-family HTH domain
MSISVAKAIVSSIGESDFPPSFGEWLKHRRKELDLTQAELAARASCTIFALRKIESGERRPSKQLAGLLVKSLEIPSEDQTTFIKVARGELNVERLRTTAPGRTAGHSIDTITFPSMINLPLQPTPLIGREAELAALGKLLAEPHCRLLTITGLGGIGKTRLAIELASNQQTSFPGGVYYVSLASLDSPVFIVPAIAEVLGLSFTGAADVQEQLLNHLAMRARQALLLVLDNLEHLLLHPSEQDGKDETALLLSKLLQRLPNLKILVTSRERSNIREEWIFELHGLPVPTSDQSSRLEDYSAVALFLQRARQLKVDFEVFPDERQSLARVCQLVEGTPLAIELAATWVGMLSMEEIAQEIATNLDFLTTPMRNVPERQRSLRAVFAHSWKLLSDEERNVLCRLAVFRGGFQRQAAEQVTGASLPILMSLLAKSLLLHRENGRYDLHALIRQFALEEARVSGYLEETCHRHLAYFVSLALEAQEGLRSVQLAEWLSRIEQEHNNIRAALEWAFMPGSPAERVEKGLCLVTSIDRYWPARGHIREGITWIERGLQASDTRSLCRARALRIAGWLYNHGDDSQTAISLLQESAALSQQLNDETSQANALDTLGDVAWRFGDFAKARVYYAESLELYRRGGNARSIGLSLASAGRLHVDYGYCQEAEILLTEGLSLLESSDDLRGRVYCINSLGRLALIQGKVEIAAKRFQQALRLNHEMGYLVDLSECLHELAVVEAIAGDENSATLLWAAASALQKKIGFTYPVNDPIFLQAPASWLQSAPFSEVWSKGERMSTDQAVAYALEREAAD